MGKAFLKFILIFGGLTVLNWIVFNSCSEGDMNWFRFLLCIYPIPLGIFMLPLLANDNNDNNDNNK